MVELRDEYNQLLNTVEVPAPHDGRLDDEINKVEQNRFFAALKRALEPKLSYLALDSCFSVERHAPQEGERDYGMVADRLTIEGGGGIGFALQTSENGKNSVHFGINRVDEASEQLLAAIEEADRAFSDVTYHG